MLDELEIDGAAVGCARGCPRKVRSCRSICMCRMRLWEGVKPFRVGRRSFASRSTLARIAFSPPTTRWSRQEEAGKLSSYHTFPRSARASPTTSGASTPARGASSALLFSSPTRAPPATSPISIPSGESIYARLTRRISHGQGNEAGGDARSLPERDAGQQRWDEGRYRDAVERAQHQGDPTSWQVLHAAIASSSSDGPVLRSPSARAGSPAGGKQLARKRSSDSHLLRSSFSGHQREDSATPTITEEPDSYAELRPVEDDNHSFALPSPRKSIYTPNGQTLAVEDAQGDSDDDSEDDSAPRKPTPIPTRLYDRIFPLSSVTKNVIKCVIAYFLAEMWTFVPVLTDFLGSPWDVDGPVKNAHV